jgi:hypothetical protein
MVICTQKFTGSLRQCTLENIQSNKWDEAEHIRTYSYQTAHAKKKNFWILCKYLLGYLVTVILLRVELNAHVA